VVDYHNWDDIDGDWDRADVEDWYNEVTMLLNEDPDTLSGELEELYRSVEAHFDAHNDLASDGEYADAFYELESAFDDKISYDMVLKGINKEPLGEL